MAMFIGFPLNLPHYLVKSLIKMSSAIKKGPRNISHSLFHHGLVRILVERELSKLNPSWDEFIESNGFLAFCHCQFDCLEECLRHQEPSRVSASPVCKPVSKPTGYMSPDVCNNSSPPPVSSPGTPVPFKRMKKSSSLYSERPKCNTDICK